MTMLLIMMGWWGVTAGLRAVGITCAAHVAFRLPALDAPW